MCCTAVEENGKVGSVNRFTTPVRWNLLLQLTVLTLPVPYRPWVLHEITRCR